MNYIPKNLDECIEYLIEHMSDKDKLHIRCISEDDMGGFHFSTGMSMRNNWGLWNQSILAKWFNSIGVYHADDMSGIIMISLHRTLNNKPINLESQIRSYDQYWLILLGKEEYENMKIDLTKNIGND